MAKSPAARYMTALRIDIWDARFINSINNNRGNNNKYVDMLSVEELNKVCKKHNDVNAIRPVYANESMSLWTTVDLRVLLHELKHRGFCVNAYSSHIANKDLDFIWPDVMDNYFRRLYQRITISVRSRRFADSTFTMIARTVDLPDNVVEP